MKQLVILSGKGGTGKTAVVASLAHLAREDETMPEIILADADVDASNLELLVGSRRFEKGEFWSGSIAEIEPEKCVGCGICYDVCRFQAIQPLPEEGLFRVDPLSCEGCAACFYQCPDGAIRQVPQMVGHWFRSTSRYGPLFHARLGPGQENSGKLVTLVKEKARDAARSAGSPLVLVDGPPGIGCPAIAAATDSDLALIVTEPTVSGIHDLERILGMTRHFRLRTLVTVNKGDLNPEGREAIQERCQKLEIPLLPWIPFEEGVTRSLMEGLPVTEHEPDSRASRALGEIWEALKSALRIGHTAPLQLTVPAFPSD
ncbi:MAG: ATP-binding protein [Gemmatimonadota bacterium]